MKSLRIMVISCGLLVAATAQAQRGKPARSVVPPSLRPPAGMCRIWLDGVPAGRQPAPTDCASALRNRPANGQVIFGDDFARPDSARGGAESRADGAPLKGLAPLPRALDPRAGDSGQGKKPDEAKRKAEHGKPAAHKPDTTATDPSGQVTGLLR